jgi:hypothetical protein
MNPPRHRQQLVALASLVAGASIAAASAACSALIGLDPPPDDQASATDGGASSDATTTDGAASDASSDAAPVVCAPLDAGDGGFAPFAQTTLPDGTSTWSFFDTSSLTTTTNAFTGGVFDGQYVYFVGKGQWIARYDATLGAAAFDGGAAWSVVRVTSLAPVGSIPGGFLGAVFDGRYVYFVPDTIDGATSSVAARFDTRAASASLTDPAAWTTFDLSVLNGSGAPLKGFYGGSFDGRYVYFVPHNDGAPDGRVARYDTKIADAGTVHAPSDGGDAGDAGDAGPTGFDDVGQWETFDLAGVSPAAVGFAGAAFDGTSVYFVPSVNDAYDASVDNGNSAIVARLLTDASFESSGSWSTFDLTKVNGEADDFFGGAFDGRNLYLVPRGNGIAVQFDTAAKGFTVPASWSTYDLERIITREAGASPAFTGAAFDGRFVYYVPSATGFGTVARYDSLSSFHADCAWSTVDLTQLDAGANAGASNFAGAVFDGTYVYFVPASTGVVARFAARSVAATGPFSRSFL